MMACSERLSEVFVKVRFMNIFMKLCTNKNNHDIFLVENRVRSIILMS